LAAISATVDRWMAWPGVSEKFVAWQAQAVEKIMRFYGKEAELTRNEDAFRIKGKCV
jgi:hypothetical protein